MAHRTVTLAFAGLTGLLALVPAARAQDLCARYELRPDDTLAAIAATLGIEGGARAIYDANRAVMPSPDIFLPGTVIVIPCADGSLPGQDPPAAGPSPLPQIRFLTGGRYAPFTDRDAPNGGMIAEMVGTAMRQGDPRQAFRIDFVNDWGAHLSTLLPTGAFDMGFPWHIPDCASGADLPPPAGALCSDYDHSDPLFEATVGYYVRADGPYAAAADPAGLLGARLCRPRGWLAFDPAADRLVEPEVSLLLAPTPVACWEALKAGEVDVVAFDALAAEADLDRLGLVGTVAELPQLASVQTLHVVVPKTNANAVAALEILDRGLAELRRSGRWSEIVARHLGPEAAARVRDPD